MWLLISLKFVFVGVIVDNGGTYEISFTFAGKESKK